MFAGVECVLYQENTVNGIQSKEGEQVQFIQPFEVAGGINEWLERVDKQLQFTLSADLQKVLDGLGEGKGVAVVAPHVAQIVILAFQIYLCWLVEKQIQTKEQLAQDFVFGILNSLTQGITGDLPGF